MCIRDRDIGVGVQIEGSSGNTKNGVEVRKGIYDTPASIRVEARTDTEAEEIGKLVCGSIERKDLPICGPQSFLNLFRPSIPIQVKESEELYTFTANYTIRTDVNQRT